jgi:SsrA-binding protein
MATEKKAPEGPRILNRRARHDYDILDRVEAGLELRGCEVKSIRGGQAGLADSYARIDGGEAFLYGMYIAPYAEGSYNNPPSRRRRRLLLHRREIARLASKVAAGGYTLVPLALYFKRGYAKVELGLARGRRTYDKREAIKKREAEREMRRAVRGRRPASRE